MLLWSCSSRACYRRPDFAALAVFGRCSLRWWGDARTPLSWSLFLLVRACPRELLAVSLAGVAARGCRFTGSRLVAVLVFVRRLDGHARCHARCHVRGHVVGVRRVGLTPPWAHWPTAISSSAPSRSALAFRRFGRRVSRSRAPFYPASTGRPCRLGAAVEVAHRAVRRFVAPATRCRGYALPRCRRRGLSGPSTRSLRSCRSGGSCPASALLAPFGCSLLGRFLRVVCVASRSLDRLGSTSPLAGRPLLTLLALALRAGA